MKFRIEVSGTHEEGAESRNRFDKITRTFIESLTANGYIATYAVSTPDMLLNPVSLLLSKGGDPEPASWQAATLSDAERAPAKAEAATVATQNQPAISKADERRTDAKLQPEISGHSNTKTEGDGSPTNATEGEVPEAVVEADAELAKHDNPKLHLDPASMTVPKLKTFLSENDYTVEELDTAIADEMANKNRDEAVRALKQARDARIAAVASEAETSEATEAETV